MGKPILLDFSATWCGPCKMQKPIIDDLKEKYGDQVDIKEVDVDENGEMARNYNVMAVPTIVIEKDGEEVKRFTGLKQADVLSAELDKLL
ncbi:Thioredoxin domain protein [Methanohalobium evestigatum Z-7303]|uniref:Thioredoxin domain protein n=2 Tax=Methanohalobium TaxID=2321 RepID=D7E5Y3_METEZ|nr:Thioredoxin domain protein [Methanohalobium evestigatum Z-7303]